MELDANAKLGGDIITNDPNIMSYNGKIMYDLILRQKLNLGNTSEFCIGTITRHRSTIEKEEKPVLDYLVYCDKMKTFFNTMLIDESRVHVLKRYVTTKGFKKHTESDHNTIFANFSLKYVEQKMSIRREMFNFHDTECK